MRYRLALLPLMLAFAVCGDARAQSRLLKPAPVKIEPAGYKLIRDDGSTLLVKEYKLDGKFYLVSDIRGRSKQYLARTVTSILPLDAAQVADEQSRTEAEDESRADASKARTEARSTARTTARTSGRSTARVPAPEPPPRAASVPEPPSTPYVAPGAGYTATGLPLHVGPRGGIYHYSANGKKVYQRKK